MKHYMLCLSFLVVMLVPACGGPEEITQPGGKFVEEFSEAICSRAVECFGGNQAECIDGVVSALCMEEPDYCAEVDTQDASDWNACLDAVADLSCASIDAGITPSECYALG